jgi:hypothetical protein
LAQELNQFETPKYHEKKVAAIPGAWTKDYCEVQSIFPGSEWVSGLTTAVRLTCEGFNTVKQCPLILPWTIKVPVAFYRGVF